jgi:hypothetical protein
MTKEVRIDSKKKVSEALPLFTLQSLVHNTYFLSERKSAYEVNFVT